MAYLCLYDCFPSISLWVYLVIDYTTRELLKWFNRIRLLDLTHSLILEQEGANFNYSRGSYIIAHVIHYLKKLSKPIQSHRTLSYELYERAEKSRGRQQEDIRKVIAEKQVDLMKGRLRSLDDCMRFSCKWPEIEGVSLMQLYHLSETDDRCKYVAFFDTVHSSGLLLFAITRLT